MEKKTRKELYITIGTAEEYRALTESGQIPSTQHRRQREPITFTQLSADADRAVSVQYDFTTCICATLCDIRKITAGGAQVHSHDFFELTYVAEGEYEMQVEDRSYRYTKGNLLLLNRNTRHSENMPAVGLKNDYLGLDASFFRNYPQDFGSPYPPGGKLARFFEENLRRDAENNKDYLSFVPRTDDGTVRELFLMLEKVFRENDRSAKLKVYAIISELFSQLENEALYEETYTDLGTFPELRIMEQTRELIEETRGRISREELARRLGYSTNHIYRCYKKLTGLTISAACRQEQLKHACRLLEDSDRSIAEIAESAGYTNRTQFYKTFEESYGCTPKEYRERGRSRNAD